MGKISLTMLLAAFVIAGCSAGGEDAEAEADGETVGVEESAEETEEPDGATGLQAVHEVCADELDRGRYHGELADEGHTLVLPGVGRDASRDQISHALASIDCVLDGTEASTAVRERIGTTRALDGRQEGEWSTFSASWTYHPRSGLNLIIEESSDTP